MITAKKAKHLSMINSRAKIYIENLEKVINEATKNGELTANIMHGIEADHKEIMDAIITELHENGYEFEYAFAEPLPAGCPSDQWQFENGFIKVYWG